MTPLFSLRCVVLRGLALSAIAFCCSIPLACAQTAPADAPPVNAAALLASLKAVKEQQAHTLRNAQGQALQAIMAAGADDSSALNAYVSAVQATQFQADGAQGIKFQEWKKKEGEKLRNRDFVSAIRLHLNYLALTLRRAAGIEVKNLLPDLIGFTQTIDTHPEIVDAAPELLSRPVTNSPFAKFFEITGWMNVPEWEMVPGNVDGIYTQTILPEFRKERDPRIIDYWDAVISREADAASLKNRASDVDQFNLLRKPALLWNQAKDMLAIGEKNRAINAMFAIVKAYPTHPDFAAWTATLENLLAPPAPPASAAAQTPDPVISAFKPN